MSVTCEPVFCASCESARFWSRRRRAEKAVRGRSGAFSIAMRAFVLQGFPTTSTFTLREAASFRARPCVSKIEAFASRRSARSMPGPRGRAPIRKTYSAPSKASAGSRTAFISASVGKAQSSSSIMTPFRAAELVGLGRSRSVSDTGWSGPSMAPEARRKRIE